MAKYKLLPGFHDKHTGEIFDTKKPVPKYEYWQKYESWEFILNTWGKYFQLIPEPTEDEILLEEAKKRYPIGTKYIPTFRDDKRNFSYIQYSPFLHESKEIIQDGPGGFSIWSKSKGWAKIIKEEPMSTEKTIIGYKLIKPEYEKVAVKALQLSSVFSPNIIIAGMISYYTPKIKELGIMDWFEPVYEKSSPDITINGYKGEFFDNYVKFGCAEIHKNIFIDINTLNKDLVNGDGIIGRKSNRTINSVTIGSGTFTKNQIKEIAEYYINKK